MAVNIDATKKFIDNLGIDKEGCGAFIDVYGIKIGMSIGSLVVYSNTHKIKKFVKVEGISKTLATDFGASLGPMSKQALAMKVCKVVKEIVEEIKHKEKDQESEDINKKKEDGAVYLVDASEDVYMGPPIPLSKADTLLLPVHGTSDGSIYHVVGIGGDIAVAVRYKNDGQLSVRVDRRYGATISKLSFSSLISKAGLGMKDGGHASDHFHVGDDTLAVRTVGSILAVLAGHLDSVYMRVDLLKGKGK